MTTNKSYVVISGIVAGGQNVIDNGYASFISGGDHNHIISPIGTSTQVDRSFIGGGIGNYIYEQCSSIVGGCENAINAGGIGSFIGGGSGNTISGACSAILGGSGNSDGGLAYVGIFGQGITAVANGHFHVNNLWMAPATYNTYAGVAPGGTFPLGTIYADTTANNTLRIQ